mmetsp:Transcript_28805/g.89637  ORF Transcript_28805/g.89637 Transcript_28805/m.89637 type:complete len:92 (-) Transcript_28805:1468-1743(-)
MSGEHPSGSAAAVDAVVISTVELGKDMVVLTLGAVVLPVALLVALLAFAPEALVTAGVVLLIPATGSGAGAGGDGAGHQLFGGSTSLDAAW